MSECVGEGCTHADCVSQRIVPTQEEIDWVTSTLRMLGIERSDDPERFDYALQRAVERRRKGDPQP